MVSSRFSADGPWARSPKKNPPAVENLGPGKLRPASASFVFPFPFPPFSSPASRTRVPSKLLRRPSPSSTFFQKINNLSKTTHLPPPQGRAGRWTNAPAMGVKNRQNLKRVHPIPERPTPIPDAAASKRGHRGLRRGTRQWASHGPTKCPPALNATKQQPDSPIPAAGAPPPLPSAPYFSFGRQGRKKTKPAPSSLHPLAHQKVHRRRRSPTKVNRRRSLHPPTSFSPRGLKTKACPKWPAAGNGCPPN